MKCVSGGVRGSKISKIVRMYYMVAPLQRTSTRGAYNISSHPPETMVSYPVIKYTEAPEILFFLGKTFHIHAKIYPP